jgi:antitoxin component YwqK of YwqJK toxin-antitoxin module
MSKRPYISILAIFLAFFIAACADQSGETSSVDSTPINTKPTFVATVLITGDTIVTLTSYYETGEVKCTQELIGGQRHGFEKFYFKNGILKYEIYYIGNQEWAVGEGHSIDGKVLDLGTLNFGTGSFKAYYDDGTPYIIGYWKHDNVDSLWTYYYSSGKPEREVNWKNGVQHGVSRRYYESGKIMIDSDWEYGRELAEKQYHKNGNLYHETSFKDGVLHGECREYYDNGILSQLREYEYGLQSGKYNSYYRSGKIEWEAEMKNNLPSGIWKHYNQDGKLIEEKSAEGKSLSNMGVKI